MRRLVFLILSALLVGPVMPAAAQTTVKPEEYLPGKDVVWVPSSPAMVQLMLDLAKVTPADTVLDLGSGDGRTVVAAAQRGARGIGVEFNPELVARSQERARAAGVDGRATFIRGDMYEADLSKATVLALFLLPRNLEQLREKFLALAPGTRIVLNTFPIPGWEADDRAQLSSCEDWCDAMLLIVPAKVGGAWRLGGDRLVVEQAFQKITGTLTDATGASYAITAGSLRGDRLTFTVNGRVYTGRVDGARLVGDGWSATRER